MDVWTGCQLNDVSIQEAVDCPVFALRTICPGYLKVGDDHVQ